MTATPERISPAPVNQFIEQPKASLTPAPLPFLKPKPFVPLQSLNVAMLNPTPQPMITPTRSYSPAFLGNQRIPPDGIC
ncbi:uncharacterized protein MONOS_8084 [Monocercomonoides exilis]|uniref:uncharacterized protein n=1 Tax=Monocercomonoides exilis TaxID=2049356 RepID=UPI00355A1D66|nr:hypothetical protein MONOS_8084 [Monocercomonoides exilis]|eukprot:MONOS_8084.1-p1 / transcript=MONOS_8084.1 / gene=MONOS_8084 / organism=Monocercomonoides_exilis_PA203 / gene_product=unspecified product / transcript_product=unspecified product / location=Mono_scaffold00295:38835-39071(-) / protein_length=79 / sequence_SO=supercontig / SO=protein_coding / is_pseudo=false